jgi:hypothetical protein
LEVHSTKEDYYSDLILAFTEEVEKLRTKVRDLEKQLDKVIGIHPSGRIHPYAKVNCTEKSKEHSEMPNPQSGVAEQAFLQNIPINSTDNGPEQHEMPVLHPETPVDHLQTLPIDTTSSQGDKHPHAHVATVGFVRRI